MKGGYRAYVASSKKTYTVNGTVLKQKKLKKTNMEIQKVLSRTPYIDEITLSKLIQIAKDNNYEIDNLLLTEQNYG